MEFAAVAASGSVRDLPPSKRFRFVGSSLGSAPCLPAKKRVWPPMPETAAVPVCLPAKKRAYAPPLPAAEGDFSLCLPAKKRAYAPPVDDAVAPACLPAKKRVPAPPAPAPEKAAISPTIPVPVRKRVHAPAPAPAADPDASARVPFKDVANTLPPARNAGVSPIIPAKNVQGCSPPSTRDIAATPVSVCLPSNKRVMPPFLPPPSPLPPSMESDRPRVAAAAKEAKPQGSNKCGGAITNGVKDYARADTSKIPEKPINPKEIKEQVLKKPRAKSPKESEDQECKKSREVVISANQSEEVQVEALKKACKAIDLNEAAREEDSSNGEEAALEPKQEAMAATEEGEEEDDGVHCAVCGSTDGDPSDPIVFCDGCDLMVHASCYGNPLSQSIPDGDWFCSVCSRNGGAGAAKKSRKPPRCCLCPGRGGAMKPTTDGDRWAHIACALLVPEVFFRDADGRDGVDCSRIPASRFAMDCYVCESSRGCALECSQPKCGLGFHVSCGLDAGLCIEYREAKATAGAGAAGAAVVAGFCLEHTKLWEKQQLTGKYKIVSRGQK